VIDGGDGNLGAARAKSAVCFADSSFLLGFQKTL
jgi:hypothetical protein